MNALKARFYPRSAEEETFFAKVFGCARFVYNFGLDLRMASWSGLGERMSYEETAAAVAGLKLDPDYAWLKEPSSVPLQQSLRNLNTAFERFFKGLGRRPQFKTKNDRQSATFELNALSWHAGQHELTLAKMGRPLAIKWSRRVPKGAVLKRATVSKDASGRYHVSLVLDEEIPLGPPATEAACVGIDWGVKHFVTLSNGEAHDHPRPYLRLKQRLARAQRDLSRKARGSKNRVKARLAVAKIHAKIADIRKDFLNKLSTYLVNRFEGIAVETLAIKNLMKNHKLAAAIGDGGWGEFVRQLEYKCARRGRKFTKIDRFAASTKTCSECDHKMPDMKLSVREWACPVCGALHDRDVNAAKNIKRWGFDETGEVLPQKAKAKVALRGLKRRTQTVAEAVGEAVGAPAQEMDGNERQEKRRPRKAEIQLLGGMPSLAERENQATAKTKAPGDTVDGLLEKASPASSATPARAKAKIAGPRMEPQGAPPKNRGAPKGRRPVPPGTPGPSLSEAL